jgi:2-polyprenyl-3-methyl-5-hydroxy-6-metoxy-1,4-benzoquinol methylase
MSIALALSNLASKYRRQAARHARRAGHGLFDAAGWLILPPYRCPGCSSLRLSRRLAECGGATAASMTRGRVFATGCRHCGLLFASPRPSHQQLDDWYSTDGEWASAHQPATTETARTRRIGNDVIAAIDASTGVSHPPADGEALDVGCGHGKWLDTLADLGWKTYGIDPAIKSAFVRHAELAEIPMTPRFGFVVLSHVLEHVPAPGALLTALSRATVNGGSIYVAVPNLDRLPDHKDWFYVLNARTHLAAYSLACLTHLLGRAGFGDVRVVQSGTDEKGGKRLRVVARRGAHSAPVPSPLSSALRSLDVVRRE